MATSGWCLVGNYPAQGFGKTAEHFGAAVFPNVSPTLK